MERQPVKSSVIAALGYDRQTQMLEVEFTTGRVYEYFAVPATVFEGFLKAESIGRYFNAHVRDHYRVKEVT